MVTPNAIKTAGKPHWTSLGIQPSLSAKSATPAININIAQPKLGLLLLAILIS